MPILSDKYKHKNKNEYRICSAAISPRFFGALMLFRDGTVKFANWSGGKELETFLEVADGERLEDETEQTRGSSSMAFTENGMRHRGEHVSRTPWRLWHLGHACSAASGSLPREPCETLRRARTHATRAVGAHVLRKTFYGLPWALAQVSASSRVTKGSL